MSKEKIEARTALLNAAEYCDHNWQNFHDEIAVYDLEECEAYARIALFDWRKVCDLNTEDIRLRCVADALAVVVEQGDNGQHAIRSLHQRLDETHYPLPATSGSTE